MAVKIRDSFGARAAKSAAAPRLAPATDLGLGEAGRTLQGMANRLEDKADRKRSIAEAEAKQTARDVAFEEKQLARELELEDKRKTEEADRLDLYSRKQAFALRASTRFVEDFDAGKAAQSGYLDSLTADLEAQITQEVADAPEPLRARLELELREARGSVIAQHRGTIIDARTRATTQMAEDGLDSVVNETRIAPGLMTANLAKVDQFVDAMDINQEAKIKLKDDYRSQVAGAALEARIQANPAAVTRDIQAGKFADLLKPEQLDRALDNARDRSEKLAVEAERRRAIAEVEQRQQQAIARQEQREREVNARQQAAIAQARRNDAERHAAEMANLRRQAAAPGVQAGIADNLASLINSGSSAANAPSVGQVRSILGQEAGSRYELALNQATQTYTATVGFEGLSGGGLTARVLALKPRAGQAGYAAALEIYQGAAQRASQIQQARGRDPVGYWRSTETFTQAVDQVARQPAMRGKNRSDIENYVLINLQRNRGGATDGRVRMLSAEQASGLAAQLRPGSGPRGAQNALAVLSSLTTTYGREGASTALADIAEAGRLPQIAALSAVAPAAQRQAAELLFADRGATMTTKDKKEVDAALLRQMGPLLSSQSGSRGGSEAQRPILSLAATMVGQMEASGVPRQDAIATASAMFTGNYTFRQGLRFPQAQSGSSARILSSAADAKRELMINPALLAPVGGRPGDAALVRQRDYADRVRSARWINTFDDTGLMLQDANGRAVRRADGTDVILTWDQLRTRRRALGGGLGR